MIAFACSQCGKRFDRQDSASGSIVFCECGARNVVPWESTLSGPPPLPPEPASVPPLTAWSRAYPERPAVRRRDPAYCFNHQDTPVQHACAACNEKFCGDCVLTLEGKTLCGPCKNFQVRGKQRPPQVSVMAIFSPLVAMISAPALGLALLMAVGFSAAQSLTNGAASMPVAVAVVGLAAIGVQFFSLLLGAASLRQVETNPRISGRSLAITGMVAGVVYAILLGEFAVLMVRVLE